MLRVQTRVSAWCCAHLEKRDQAEQLCLSCRIPCCGLCGRSEPSRQHHIATVRNLLGKRYPSLGPGGQQSLEGESRQEFTWEDGGTCEAVVPSIKRQSGGSVHCLTSGNPAVPPAPQETAGFCLSFVTDLNVLCVPPSSTCCWCPSPG